MTLDQAKVILSGYRPNGRDADDPRFSEALELARHHPELARWFAEQQAFDGAMTQALTQSPVPLGLKAAILLRAQAGRPEKLIRLPWWHWRAPIPISAVAATFLMLAVIGALWLYEPSDQYADFRDEVVARTWAEASHLRLHTGDLTQIRAWLASQGAAGNFILPKGLSDLRPVGCSTVEWRGNKVGLLCLSSGSRHYHLYIAPETMLHNPPPHDQPRFEMCGHWRTAGWSHEGTTYLLSGMNNLMFVRKLRSAGHWQWSS